MEFGVRLSCLTGVSEKQFFADSRGSAVSRITRCSILNLLPFRGTQQSAREPQKIEIVALGDWGSEVQILSLRPLRCMMSAQGCGRLSNRDRKTVPRRLPTGGKYSITSEITLRMRNSRPGDRSASPEKTLAGISEKLIASVG